MDKLFIQTIIFMLMDYNSGIIFVERQMNHLNWYKYALTSAQYNSWSKTPFVNTGFHGIESASFTDARNMLTEIIT